MEIKKTSRNNIHHCYYFTTCSLTIIVISITACYYSEWYFLLIKKLLTYLPYRNRPAWRTCMNYSRFNRDCSLTSMIKFSENLALLDWNVVVYVGSERFFINWSQNSIAATVLIENEVICGLYCFKNVGIILKEEWV